MAKYLLTSLAMLNVVNAPRDPAWTAEMLQAIVYPGKAFDAFVEAVVTDALDRFMPRLTRIDVHLSDTNANKQGGSDKRCQIEVRPASQQPVSARASADTVEKSLTIAVGKMKR